MISGLLLLLELLLLCSLCLAVSLGAYMLEAKKSSSPLTCTSVPYPFGISGKAMKGFEITCKGTSPILQLGNHACEIEDMISLQQGNLSIYTGAIAQGCEGNFKQESGWIDLEGTPYTISDTESSENTLTIVGCRAMVLLQGLSSTSSSACATSCNSTDDTVNGGYCQASIAKGLKSFNVILGSVDSVRGKDRIIPVSDVNTSCSRAFFVKQSNFIYSVEMLQDVNNNQVSQDRYLIALDWAIGHETCEEARRNMETYACKNNSYCYDSTNGFGYRCNCTQGYYGNPYIEDGCIDINECKDLEGNPCVGECINEPGNFSCPCPPGQHGDGRKHGSRCTKKENETPSRLDALDVGISVLFILIIGSLVSYWASKKRKLVMMKAKFFQQNGGLFLQQQIFGQGSNATVKIFSIEELEKATNNFSENQILGHGGYGTVFKGVLPSQKVVAIKKSKLVDQSQIEQFINEIIILSQINHRNVVRLLGCCLETQVPLLVYEFISNGTLFHHIHGENHDFSMPWKVRLRIAAEAAGALTYLHSAASAPIIHRDIKSSNILLDENYTAKVSDFGASRSISFDQTHITTLVQGTFGYLDPEYFYTSKLTERAMSIALG